MAVITRVTLPIVDAVAAEMEERRLSRRQVAEALGTSPSTVSNWLRGLVDPVLTRDMQHALAKFLGVSPFEVVEMFDVDLSRERLGGYHPFLALAV